MNKPIVLIVLLGIVGCFSVAFGDSGSTNMTARQVMRRRPVHPSGGVLERPSMIQTRPIAVQNEQNILGTETLNSLVGECRRWSRLPFQMDAQNAPATIRLVADETQHDTMIIYPESFKVIVNVKALSSDGAAKEIVAARVRKQIIRAALLMFGSGYSPSFCLARPVTSLQELDDLNPRVLSMETMSHLTAMPRLGIHEVYFYTYRQACREGWAPPPTNDIQKAIWEQFKADKERGPTNPITIKPPSAKK